MDDDLYVITGPNGGGKSTLFRVLSGVRKIRNMSVRGEANLYGNNPLIGPDPRVAAVFQESFRYYLGSTPRGEISIHLRRAGYKGRDFEARLRDAIRKRNLEPIANVPMNRLSDGEKLRTILAALLATEPKGFILDEPLGSLDPIRATRVVRILKELGKPALVFEHRREFFGRAHAAIENGTLTKPRRRKRLRIECRRDGDRVRVKLFDKYVEVPKARRGIIAIRGPNGSGKTTLLRSLFKSLSKGLRVVYVPSDPNLVIHKPRAELEADRIFRGPVRRLSFGQRKELSVVIGLSREADIYLLDEPFKGLDDAARERVLALMLERSGNSAVYFATNERESIEAYGSTLRVENGDVYEEGYPSRAKRPDDISPRPRGGRDRDAHSGLAKIPEDHRSSGYYGRDSFRPTRVLRPGFRDEVRVPRIYLGRHDRVRVLFGPSGGGPSRIVAATLAAVREARGVPHAYLYL